MEEQFSEFSEFSASSSLSGYLYQCRYAFLESLRRLRYQMDFSISIESLDDVVFETEGNITEILQTKHHVNRVAKLTDASSDLWKSIRIWCELFMERHDSKTLFYLITTSPISESSIANLLSEGENRDVELAITLLDSIANSSTNTENANAYQAFKLLTGEEKLDLFESVFILGSNPNLLELDNCIRQELYFAVEGKYLEDFMIRIEGWWGRRVIQQISKKEFDSILSEEISEELNYIREQFKADNLPIDDDILLSTINEPDFSDRVFVKQLHLINIGEKRIFFAIRDYFRAFTQRSRWIREDLLYVGELDRYERRLKEEWELHFEEMRENLGEITAEEEKQKAARALYKWVEQGNLMQIRSGVSEPSIPRGSYQILADDFRVGWHLEFANRLKVILEV